MDLSNPNQKRSLNLKELPVKRRAKGFPSVVLLVFVLLFFLPNTGRCTTFDFNRNCVEAYELILSLRFEEGKALLEKEKKLHPNNAVPYYVENYIDFLNIFIHENESEFEVLEENKDFRLEKLEAGPKDSPYYNYFIAEVHLQWAMSRLKFEEYLTAFLEVRKSYRLLEANREKFPDFTPNNKSLGLLHTMIGTIPDSYKWGVNILGLDGSIEQGMGELKALIQDDNKQYAFVKNESLILYTFLSLYITKEEDYAWKNISDSTLQLQDNLLNHFVAATVAMRTGHNDQAIELLMNRPKDDRFTPFHFLDYLLGLAKLHRLDKNAIIYLSSYVQKHSGKNYIKDAYQKMAWYYLINGDKKQYHHYMEQCLKNGALFVDADKQAQKEAESGEVPNPQILKLRLLFDGGYYERASQVEKSIDVNTLNSFKEELELNYRKGRLYHEWDKEELAIGYYKKTIEDGYTEPYYYAANACLKLGNIFEQRGELEKAKDFYHKALDSGNHEYKNSIDQKAKAGLNRMKG